MYAQATGKLLAAAPHEDSQAIRKAYSAALARGRMGRLWSSLTGRSCALFSLQDASQAFTVQARSSAGRRSVAIAQIRGSEGRAADFDRDFNPLQDHTQPRWLGIASAVQRGRNLPPVVLIQVNDLYFVRDGHHRISVARALGRHTVEATIEVWQVSVPPSGQQLAHARKREGPRRPAGGAGAGSLLRWISGGLRPADGAGACPAGS